MGCATSVATEKERKTKITVFIRKCGKQKTHYLKPTFETEGRLSRYDSVQSLLNNFNQIFGANIPGNAEFELASIRFENSEKYCYMVPETKKLLNLKFCGENITDMFFYFKT